MEETPRLGRTAQLLGEDAMGRLARAHVLCVGVGGVGSWAAEMLVRAGVGELTLVDFDTVSPTDFNRQLPATETALGRPKVDVLAERFAAIRPDVRVNTVKRRLDVTCADTLLEPTFDHVVDAIDLLTDKSLLIELCLQRSIPIVTSTGAGARLDPTRIEVVDLAQTRVDPIARDLRHILRKKYERDLSEAIGVPAVFSTEPRYRHPRLPGPGDKGPDGMPRKQPIEGTLGCVTGAFGMAAAGVVIGSLTAPTSPASHPSTSSARRARPRSGS